MEQVKKISYSTGLLVGQLFVAPFVDGLMDSIEPRIKERFTLPSWVDNMMRSVFQ